MGRAMLCIGSQLLSLPAQARVSLNDLLNRIDKEPPGHPSINSMVRTRITVK
ncbi:MAG: hypothetical protein ABW168_23705 [Sedimenticola sp.]